MNAAQPTAVGCLVTGARPEEKRRERRNPNDLPIVGSQCSRPHTDHKPEVSTVFSRSQKFFQSKYNTKVSASRLNTIYMNVMPLIWTLENEHSAEQRIAIVMSTPVHVTLARPAESCGRLRCTRSCSSSATGSACSNEDWHGPDRFDGEEKLEEVMMMTLFATHKTCSWRQAALTFETGDQCRG